MKSWKSKDCPCEIAVKGQLVEERFCQEHASLERKDMYSKFGLKWEIWKPMTCQINNADNITPEQAKKLCHVEEILVKNGDTFDRLGVIRVFNKCNAHKDVLDEEIPYTIYGDPDTDVIGESMLQAYTRGYLIGKGGMDFGFHVTKRHKDGTSAGEDFKDGFTYKWKFIGSGKNRQLEIDVIQHEPDENKPFFKRSVLNDQNRKTIKEACDRRFGKDRVFPL